MAIYPKIDSPCPYVNRLSSIMDGDMCRMCKRQVFDLTDMSDDERVAFMKDCSGQVCVSYRFPVKKVAAAALAFAAIAVPMSAAACDATDVVFVSGGGINDPANTKFVENPSDAAIPGLPVVYDDAKQKPASNAEPSSSTPAKTAAVP